jgi:hypothetical protein
MVVVPDEDCRDLSLDRSPDLLDGIEIRRVRRKMHEMDIVPRCVLPDENCMMRAEVVEDNDEPFTGVRSLILSQHFPDVFLFGAFSEGDDGHAIDGKDAKRVSPDLRGVFHERRVVERPHPLGIGRGLRRALIQKPEYRVLAHPREFFLSSRFASAGLRWSRG